MNNDNIDKDIERLILSLSVKETLSDEENIKLDELKKRLSDIKNEENEKNKIVNTVVTTSLGTTVAATAAPSIIGGVAVGTAAAVATSVVPFIAGAAAVAAIWGIGAKISINGKFNKTKKELVDNLENLSKVTK